MRLRNGEHGYGVVTKFLHWLTVAAIAGQFAVGWTMEADDPALFDEWIARWEDLTEFEVYPVLSSAEAAMRALD